MLDLDAIGLANTIEGIILLWLEEGLIEISDTKPVDFTCWGLVYWEESEPSMEQFKSSDCTFRASSPRSRWAVGHEDIRWIKFPDVETFMHWISDTSYNSVSVMSNEAYAAHQKAAEEREERKRLAKMNRWVKGFCEKNGVEMYSIEFIEALNEKLEADVQKWEDRIYGAQEDGLCLGMGCSASEWYDHVDGLKESRSDAACFAGEVMEWVKTELPMIHAKWAESKLVEA